MEVNPVIPAIPQATPEDIQAITETCRDYTEGWFTANEERMRHSLHPELVKRGIKFWQKRGKLDLGEVLSAKEMVNFTKEGGGSNAPETEKTFEVTVLDVFRHIATAKVSSYPYMDYLQLAKIDGQWLIVNGLYEPRLGQEII